MTTKAEAHHWNAVLKQSLMGQVRVGVLTGKEAMRRYREEMAVADEKRAREQTEGE